VQAEAQASPSSKATAQTTAKETTKTTAIAKPKQTRRTYSLEDKQYIADTNNPIEDVMEMFDFKDRKTAIQTRSYMKKQLGLNK